MVDNDILNTVQSVDSYIRSRPWFDVDVIECNPRRLILVGGIDLTGVGTPEIEIQFENIFLSLLLMTWKTDTAAPVFQLLSGEEARAINILHQIEQGYHLFRFQPEHYAATFGCLVAAESISWRRIAASSPNDETTHSRPRG